MNDWEKDVNRHATAPWGWEAGFYRPRGGGGILGRVDASSATVGPMLKGRAGGCWTRAATGDFPAAPLRGAAILLRKATMTRSYLPGREAELISYTGNLEANSSAAPGDFGLSVEQAADYRTTRTRFVDAYDVCQSGATRSPTNQTLKSEAKKKLLNATRMLVDVVQAWPMMTDAKRQTLRITVPDRTKTSVPPPSEMAQVEMVQAIRHTVRVKVKNPDGTRRRPAEVAGAQVFYATGPDAPADQGEWRSAGLWTSGTFDVTFPADTAPGHHSLGGGGLLQPQGAVRPDGDGRQHEPAGRADGAAGGVGWKVRRWKGEVRSGK